MPLNCFAFFTNCCKSKSITTPLNSYAETKEEQERRLETGTLTPAEQGNNSFWNCFRRKPTALAASITHHTANSFSDSHMPFSSGGTTSVPPSPQM
jgi:hypothetical protein